MSSAGSSDECSICQLPFATSPQSKRHSCPFCGRAFSRVDSARRHAKTCPRKGKETQAPKSKRGRKPRACDICARLKVQCDFKVPCQRCSLRSVNCTYRWLCKDLSHQNSLKSSDREETTADTQAPLSFFISCTDPAVHSLVDVMVDGEPERDPETQDDQHPATSIYEISSTVDPTLLSMGFLDPCLSMPLDFLESNALSDGSWDCPWAPVPLVSTSDKLAARITLLAAELEELVLLKSNSQINFDRISFNSLFTSSNINKFIDICIRRRNCYTPVIHWPSFNPEEAALPLLLAVVLGGAVISRSSYTSSAIPLHLIAEKYIFGKLKVCNYNNSPLSLEPLEICQAASIMFSLQHSQRNINLRQRAVNKRHPALIEALRRLKLTGNDKSSTEDGCQWADFIRRESRVRIVTWTFLNDALMVMLYNQPPSMAISEMTSFLPCSEELWDASQDGFLTFMGSRSPNSVSSRPCLRDLMADLLQEKWTNSADHPLKQLSVHGLHALIAGRSCVASILYSPL